MSASAVVPQDGEPSGTAGVPILKPLAGRGLHNGLVVVTRYFGGVKLGTGGLARAYSDAAIAALDLAPMETVRLEEVVDLTCTWDDMGTVEAVLARVGGQVSGVAREFDDEPQLKVTVTRSAAAALKRDLVEATAGRVQIKS
jgi:putative IMPACT (imprinted ancient) family translation regulator